MDSADAATPLGAWAWIRGYFTPATLFLVVNLVIGTIALTSRAATQQRRRREHYYHDDAHGHGHGHHLQEELLHPQMQQPGYGHYYHPEQTLYAAPPPPAPAPLARTSSVLDRLRSFGLYRFRSGDFPPEFSAAAGQPLNHAQDVPAPVEEEEMTATAHYARSEPASAAREEDERRPAPAPPRVKKSGSEVRKSQVARAVPRVVAAVAEDDHSVEARAEESVGGFRRGPSPLQQEYHYQEEYVPPVRARAPAASAPLQRTSSVLDRLRSFSLYGFLAPDQPAAASVPASDALATPADEYRHAHAHYDRSRSDPAPEQQGKKKKPAEAKSRMAKSSSEATKTPAPRPAEAGGECVNARAEAFIDSFRQQQQQVVGHYYQEEEYVPPPAPLSRTSSVLDRLRSFSLYRFRSGDLGPDLSSANDAAETDEKEKQQQQQAAAQYGRSRSEPAREQGKKKRQEARMSKSSSSGVAEETAETEQCVDARADDFINKFRQQLQLQRLNSLLNYKEMLGGGKQA